MGLSPLLARALSPNGDALRVERREGDSGAEGKTNRSCSQDEGGERERERDVDVLLFVDIHILHLFAVWFIAGRFCESLRPPLVLFFDRPFTTVDRR